jgi:tetratricopeptide (TPR) repeat protein
MAHVYRERGILSKSIEILRRVAQHFPREARLLEEMAQFYLARNLKDEALAVFRDLVKIQPGNPNFRTRLEDLEQEMGIGKQETPKPSVSPRSRPAATSAVAREEVSESAPEPDGVHEFGKTLSGTLAVARRAFQKGRYLRAMDPLKEIIATTSAAGDYSLFVQSHALLAECCIRLKRPKEAVQLLMQALAGGLGQDKESLELRYLLGVALEKDGQREQAILVYKKVHEIDPDYRDVRTKILWARSLQPHGPRVHS